MRPMMLNAIDFELKVFGSKHPRRSLLDGRESGLRPQPIRSVARHLQTLPCLLKKARPWIARHRQRVHLARPRARGFDHVPQSLSGEAGAMFDAIEALFFSRSDQSPVADKRRTRISMICVY